MADERHMMEETHTDDTQMEETHMDDAHMAEGAFEVDTTSPGHTSSSKQTTSPSHTSSLIKGLSRSHATSPIISSSPSHTAWPLHTTSPFNTTSPFHTISSTSPSSMKATALPIETSTSRGTSTSQTTSTTRTSSPPYDFSTTATSQLIDSSSRTDTTSRTDRPSLMHPGPPTATALLIDSSSHSQEMHSSSSTGYVTSSTTSTTPATFTVGSALAVHGPTTFSNNSAAAPSSTNTTAHPTLVTCPTKVTSLPPELLEVCIRTIDTSDISALARFSLVCKRAQRVTTPILYHTIDNEPWGENRKARMRLLCRTLTSRADIRPFVRNFLHYEEPSNADQSGVVDFCDVLHESIQSGSRRPFWHFEKIWSEYTRDNEDFMSSSELDVYPYYFLLFAPDLETIQLSGHLVNPLRLELLRIHSNSSSHGYDWNGLGKVKTVRLIDYACGETLRDDPETSDFEEPGAVVRFPMLETLYIDGTSRTGARMFLQRVPSHVTTLTIKNCFANALDTACLIRTVTEVKFLDVEIACVNDYHGYEWTLVCHSIQSCHKLVRASFVHGNLREEKRLPEPCDELWEMFEEYEFAHPWYDVEEPVVTENLYNGWFGDNTHWPGAVTRYTVDLRNLTSLEHLTLPGSVLMAPSRVADFLQTLPINLKDLVLIMPGQMGSHLANFLAAEPTFHLPNLESVVIEDWHNKYHFLRQDGELHWDGRAEKLEPRVWERYFPSEDRSY